MVYFRRVVKRRAACLTDEEMSALSRAAKKWEAHFRARDGQGSLPVAVPTVLCPYCRERHSPAEVDACMVLPRKSASAETSGSSTSKQLGAGPLLPCSELWAFLTSTSFPDGTKRRTGRLSVSCDGDMLGLLLNDEETGAYSFLNGRDLAALLEEAELRLADGSLSWRASKYQRRGK
jgi:hypothetical protein